MTLDEALKVSNQDIADYLMNVHSVATSPLVIQAADEMAATVSKGLR